MNLGGQAAFRKLTISMMDPFLRDRGCSGDNQYLDTTVIGTVK